MCIPRPKSRQSFLHGLLHCGFCAQKRTRAGTRLVRGGREVWQRWMLHQVSHAAPALNVTSWGSRQWLLVPFPETSVSWKGMFPPWPTQNLKPGSPGLVHPCPAGTLLMGGSQDSPAWLSSTRALLWPSSWQEGLHSRCSFSRPPSTRGRRENLHPRLQQSIEKVLSHILPSEISKQKTAVRSHQQSLSSSRRLCCKRKHLFSLRSREPGHRKASSQLLVWKDQQGC